MAGRILSRLAVASSLVALMTTPSWGRGSVYQDNPYRRGETIEIEGTVADATGVPAEGVTVVLLASRRSYELRSLRRVEEGLVRVAATTDAQGGFTIEWTWDPYYDTFRIRAEGSPATPAGSGGGGVVLTELDMTRRIGEGSPVVVALEVAGAGAHRALQAFTATPHSDDQKRVFEEMGKPDRVDRLEMSGGDEVAWWYFGRGKSFHFRDGRLDQVSEFEPVTGF